MRRQELGRLLAFFELLHAFPHSELVRQMLREEQQREVRQRIDAALAEGIESGRSTPMTAQDWDAIRREGQRRLKKAK